MYNFSDLLDHFASKPEIRAKIEANTAKELQDDTLIRSLANCLSSSFIWEGTPEGHEFWSKIHSELEQFEANEAAKAQ